MPYVEKKNQYSISLYKKKYSTTKLIHVLGLEFKNIYIKLCFLGECGFADMMVISVKRI